MGFKKTEQSTFLVVIYSYTLCLYYIIVSFYASIILEMFPVVSYL